MALNSKAIPFGPPPESASGASRGRALCPFGRLHVRGELRPEVLDGVEPTLVAKPGQKDKTHGPSIKVAVETREVRLEARHLAAEGRAHAEVHRGPARRGLSFDEAIRGIDAALQGGDALEINVRGREAQGRSTMIAVDNQTFDLVGPAEKPLSLAQIAAKQGVADPGGTHPPERVLEGVDLDGLEPAAPETPQRFDIPGPFRPETEAVSHHHAARTNAKDERLVDELGGGKSGHRGVEPELGQVLDARFPQ